MRAVDADALPEIVEVRAPTVLRVADLSDRELAFAIRFTHPIFGEPGWYVHRRREDLGDFTLGLDFQVVFAMLCRGPDLARIVLCVEPMP